MQWYENSWAVFDTETTGFNSTARILELGIVTFERGHVVNRWSSLFNPPDVDWNHPDVASALKVNGIKREDLAHAPRFEDKIPELLVQLDADVWVAHNFKFDARMLRQELERSRMTARVPTFPICTLEIARRLMNGVKGNTLADVAARFGVTPAGAHRAVADAETTGRVLVHMVRDGYVPTTNAEMQRLCTKKS